MTSWNLLATILRRILVGSLLALSFTAISQVEAAVKPVHSKEVIIHLLPVVTVEVDGFIDTNAARRVDLAIHEASRIGAELLVIQLDASGGFSTSARQIVSSILESPVPVAVYVAPGGAQAASVGMFVLAAAGVAAMAPFTNVGAASTVDATQKDVHDALAAKLPEDTRALARSIAYARGRDPEPLEAAITESRSYSALKAVELGIADILAPNLRYLLRQIGGESVPTADGEIRLRFNDQNDQADNHSYETYVLPTDLIPLDHFFPSHAAPPRLVFIRRTVGGCATHLLCKLVIQ